MNFSSGANVANAAIRPDRTVFRIILASGFDGFVQSSLHFVPILWMYYSSSLIFLRNGAG